MDLVNGTGVPARVVVSPLAGARSAKPIEMVIAKATFHMKPGEAVLERQTPLPILLEDQVTPLGALPRDAFAPRDDAFEVFLLGAAYAWWGPIAERHVALSVGAERRELLVVGHRVWERRSDGSRHISQPRLFERMPLTYARAFGGTSSVAIGPATFVDVSDPRNPAGKGFDPEPSGRLLAAELRVPEGYPRFDKYRELPNVEHPDRLIRAWEDSPDPVCWAAAPRMFKGSYHRAHPDWVIKRPPRGAEVRLEGLHRAYDELCFALPELRVFADYIVGSRRGVIELEPRALVILPEEDKFYLTFQACLPFEKDTAERLCLRVEEQGWFEAERGATPASTAIGPRERRYTSNARGFYPRAQP